MFLLQYLKYMVKNDKDHSNLNKFFQKITLKKQYINRLKNKTYFLNTLKDQNSKNLSTSLSLKNRNSITYNNLVTYIIDISFSRSNSLLHVMDSSGKLKFFCSAGDLAYTGKSKKTRVSVLKSMIKILKRKLKFLQNKPIAVHLTNVKFMKLWIVKSLRKKFCIKVVKNFNLYPHNGCRKRKVRRKKFKKKVLRRNG